MSTHKFLDLWGTEMGGQAGVLNDGIIVEGGQLTKGSFEWIKAIAILVREILVREILVREIQIFGEKQPFTGKAFECT